MVGGGRTRNPPDSTRPMRRRGEGHPPASTCRDALPARSPLPARYRSRPRGAVRSGRGHGSAVVIGRVFSSGPPVAARAHRRHYRADPPTGVPQFQGPELRNARTAPAFASNEPAFLSSTCWNAGTPVSTGARTCRSSSGRGRLVVGVGGQPLEQAFPSGSRPSGAYPWLVPSHGLTPKNPSGSEATLPRTAWNGRR
jgi:hypothetical protein